MTNVPIMARTSQERRLHRQAGRSGGSDDSSSNNSNNNNINNSNNNNNNNNNNHNNNNNNNNNSGVIPVAGAARDEAAPEAAEVRAGGRHCSREMARYMKDTKGELV